jgi:hypothetical protein
LLPVALSIEFLEGALPKELLEDLISFELLEALFSEDGDGVSISLLLPHEDFSDRRIFVAMNSFKLSIGS